MKRPEDLAAARALRIEKIIHRDYLDDDIDAADLAFNEIAGNPNQTDDEIARKVAMLIAQA